MAADLHVDPGQFRHVLGHVPTAVTVITAIDADVRPCGLTVGSFFSVSLEPPLVGFCAGKASSSWPAIRDAGHFSVNVLADDQGEVAARLASKGGEKFQGLGWEPGVTGAPRLDGVVAWIDCDIESIHDAGDHEICIGAVRSLELPGPADPLLFLRREFGRFTACDLRA